MMIGIATVVFGAALLIQGGTMLSEYARIIFPPDAKASSIDHFGGNSLSVHVPGRAGGIVLGMLEAFEARYFARAIAGMEN
jgi:hypothetical protein